MNIFLPEPFNFNNVSCHVSMDNVWRIPIRRPSSKFFKSLISSSFYPQQTDPEKAAAVEEKAMWLDAIDRSRGIKKKDNAELLKKTINKREKIKERSRKKWAARQDTVKKQQDDRQAKRKLNLQARREAKVSNKLKKMSKKGRVLHVPGF